mmetsp:Transcript_5820/g.13861  ORF Transcript_5820/g.13861 Transcript_5820/m.13861 type:complete len:1591 (+) Transcript_5820:108-4880(+)
MVSRTSFLIALAMALVRVNAEDAWPLSCSLSCGGKNQCTEVCQGEQTQTQACKRQAPCPDLKEQECANNPPTPCSFTVWTEWSPQGCTGLVKRTREIQTVNKCGGDPCSGALEETNANLTVLNSEGCSPKKDCAFADWEEWSSCGASLGGQRDRKRTIKTTPSNGGKACRGPLSQTQVCGSSKITLDCELSDWLDWGHCDKTCGGGEMARFRSVVQRAEGGGQACEGELAESMGCGAGDCPAEACKLADWSEWDSCTSLAGQPRLQTYRQRVVAEPGNGGEGCVGELMETKECHNTVVAINCVLGDWTTWTECSKTCEGGQTSRTREIATPAANGGAACDGTLQETEGCNTQDCHRDAEHSCHVEAWSEWGECKVESKIPCASGQQSRKRDLLAGAVELGLGCIDMALEELRGCEPESKNASCPTSLDQDCLWNDWTAWSTCTEPCNGGQQWRSRDISKDPLGSGARCPAHNMTEVQACNTQKCDVVCTNGTWADWSVWSECSRTCRGGEQWRSRRVAEPASSCGYAPEGASMEVERCNVDVDCPQDSDCELSDWEDWGECSKSCNGVQTASRTIQKHGAGMGKLCGSLFMQEAEGVENGQGVALEKTEACNTGCANISNVDCAASDWADWAACSSTCGDGQTFRSRSVKTFPSGNGKLCEDELIETKGCNSTAACPAPVNCTWGDWSDWGECTKCGGQKNRHRSIAKMPANGGAVCSGESAVDTARCQRTCGQATGFCIWEEWSEWGSCSKTCGNGEKSRNRDLLFTTTAAADAVATAASAEDCNASATEMGVCEQASCPTCEPKDCQLSEWSEWSKPTDCSKYTGLCTRSRTIIVNNTECGKPCDGTMEDSKECLYHQCSLKTDCELGDWSTWSSCINATQMYRYREVVVAPANGGEACIGELNQTETCGASDMAPEDCVLEDWSVWGPCDKPCGGGKMYRKRVYSEAANDGRACQGPLAGMPVSTEEFRPCNNHTCESADSSLTDSCSMAAWSEWTACSSTDEQVYRERHILHPATCTGQSCGGSMKETKLCDNADLATNVDCEFDDWEDWSTCSATCDGGEAQRSRKIKVAARGDGKPCSGAQVDVKACHTEACTGKEDCKLSEWKAWGVCQAQCGEGYQTRHRTVITEARRGGEGCNSSLAEVQPCIGTNCSGNQSQAVDCKWSPWNEWSPCVKAAGVCGYGYKTRNRGIAVLPSNGGQLCTPWSQSEVAVAKNCYGQPKCCVDGQWGDWTEWGKCSATCGGGIKSRSRVQAIQETWCGMPPAGSDIEYDDCGTEGHCEENVDCKLEDWTEWSACSLPCQGVQKRTRGIAANATGKGKQCTGSLEEHLRCNPGPGQGIPPGCSNASANEDCQMQPWSEWTSCSVTCGSGSVTRQRAILAPPKAGGLECETNMEEIGPCTSPLACFTDPGRVDCVWAEWSEWGACDETQHEKSRSRGYKVHKVGDGIACAGSSKDTAPCGECQVGEYYCMWEDWGAYSECSSPCGTGAYSTRKRKLKVVGAAEVNKTSSVVQRYSIRENVDLQAQLDSAKRQQTQELGFAFVGGAAALLVLLPVVSRMRARESSSLDPRYDRIGEERQDLEGSAFE